MTRCANPDPTCEGRVLHFAGTEHEYTTRCYQHDPCEACDDGRVWNNADPTSGMWVPCEECSA